MKRRALLEKWGLTGLKINLGFHEGELAKLAIPVLNQIIRPLTAKWHRISLASPFQDAARCRELRTELAALQPQLRNYTRAVAAIADVEDSTTLETAG